MLSGFPTTLAAALVVAALLPATRATAAEGPASPCPDPDALGTSRTVAIGGAPAIGLKTYPRTLDLADHEVVLTFDDGPAPATTPQVLDALKAQCVEATFFLIGRNAAAAPALVRREIAEHHSVGHHTWDHPALTLRHLAFKAAVGDIDHGLQVDDKAAGYGAWTGEPHVPFFRFPGFGDSPELLAALKARNIAVFGADLWASDWIPMTPEAEFDRLMERLRTAGRGIILLHDIKRQTADMLPRFLAALKREGFHVVHMVPGGTATPMRPAPAGWSSETERALAHLWPKGPDAAAMAVGKAVPPKDVVPSGTAKPAPDGAEDAVPLQGGQD